MFDLINCDLEKEMDIALHYASKKLDESGHNSKPVLLHSFKVAITLYQYKYSKKIIIASILHDLIEDTDVAYEDLKGEFGQDVANIVKAVSFNPNIDDKLEQAKEMFNNCIDYGYDALIVKCADLLDNINFVELVGDLKVREGLLEKYHLFLKMAKKIIGNEKIYCLLEKKYNLKNEKL